MSFICVFYHRGSYNTSLLAFLPGLYLAFIIFFYWNSFSFLFEVEISVDGNMQLEKKTCLCYVCTVHCLVLRKRCNYSVMIALTWYAQLCELYSWTKLFCLGSGARELVLGLLYLVNPLILSLVCSKKMLSHFHALSHSLLHVCIRIPETERLIDRPCRRYELWVCFLWLQGCFRARCDVVARSTPRWSAAMLRMLVVHLYCRVKGSSLISSGFHL